MFNVTHLELARLQKRLERGTQLDFLISLDLSEAPAKGITREKAKSPNPCVLTMFALTAGGDKVRASEQETPRG